MKASTKIFMENIINKNYFLREDIQNNWKLEDIFTT